MTDAVLASVTSTFQPVSNAKVPTEGPKAIPLRLDFTTVTSYLVDLTQQQQQAKISFIQGAFVDNSQSADILVITTSNSQQSVVIPGYSQAYIPLLLPNPPSFTVSSAGGEFVTIICLNIPMDIAIWSTKTQAFDFNGSGALVVSDPLLEALIAGGALTTADKNLAPLITTVGSAPGLDVNVISGGGGGSATSFIWACKELASGSFNLHTAAAGKHFELQGARVWMQPEAYLTGGGTNGFQLYDSSNPGVTIANVDVFPPVALPTTGAPVLLWEMSDMNYESVAVAASLTFQLSGAFTGAHGIAISYGIADV